MITNLLVTVIVSLVTNVSEQFPMMEVSGPYPPGYATLAVYIYHLELVPNPKEKWIITNVSEVTTFSFSWNGKDVQWALTNLITSWTNHVLLEENKRWIPDTNNAPIPQRWYRDWSTITPTPFKDATK